MKITQYWVFLIQKQILILIISKSKKMKKPRFIILIFILTLCGSACQNSQNTKVASISEPKGKSKLILKSQAFKAQKGETWNQNNLIEAQTNAEYRDSINVWITDSSILDDLEFKFQEIQQGEKDGKKITGALFKMNSLMSSMLIGGFITDEMEGQLATGHVYKIKGKYIGEIEHWPIELEDNNKFSMGSHRFQILELTEVVNPEPSYY